MLRLTVGFLVVLLLAVHNAPFIVRDQTLQWLLDNGAQHARFDRLRIDWLAGRVQIDHLAASAEGKPPLRIDNLSLELDYSALFDKRLLLKRIHIQGVDIGIREAGTALWLGPIDLNTLQQSSAKEEPAAPTEPSDWRVGLAVLALQDIHWQASVAEQNYSLSIHQGDLADLYLWDLQQQVAFNFAGEVNGAPINLTSTSQPLPEQKQGEITLQLDNFPVHSVTAPFVPGLRAMLDVDLTLKLTTDLERSAHSVLKRGSIRISDLSYQDEQLKLDNEQLRWSGEVSLTAENNQLRQLSTQGNLNLSKAAVEQNQNSLALAWLNLKTDFNMQGLERLHINDLALSLRDLALAQQDQKAQLQNLELTTQVQLSGLQEKTTAAQISDLSLAIDHLRLQQQTQQLTLASINAQASAKGADLASWHVDLPELLIKKLQVKNAETELLGLKQLQLKQASMQTEQAIALQDIQLEQLVVQGKEGVFSQWQNMALSGVQLNNLNRLKVKRIDLKNSQTRIHLDSQRNLEDLDWLLARLQTKAQDDQKSAKSAPPSEPFHVAIGQVRLSGDNRFNIRDQGVKPAFTTQLEVHKLDLKGIDTAAKRGKTQYQLKAKNKFSSLDAKGQIELFSGDFGGDWDITIKGLELPQVSPYSMEYTGYYLHSGQLNFSSQGEIAARKLAGKTDIRLNRLDVEARNDKRSGEFNQKVTMPLEMAIGILQDNDDNIDLKIPVDGSLDDPQFGYQTVINKLAGKGLRSAAMGYLSKALQPFGTLISIGQMVVDAQKKGSFISLQPIYFAPGATAIDAEAQQYLAKLANMMAERKALRMNICGRAVAADLPNIQMLLAEENKKREKPFTPEQLQVAQQERLTQLAEQRSDAIKAVLTQEKAISIERLFSCFPEVELSSDERPQAALGL